MQEVESHECDSNDVVSDEGRRWGNAMVRLAVLLSVVGAFVVIYTQFGEALTLQGLAAYESELRAFESAHPWTVVGAALLLYVIVSGLSIPGGAVALSLVYGSYFGFLRAVVIVSFGSTAGATVAFLTSRYLFRDFIQTSFVTDWYR